MLSPSLFDNENTAAGFINNIATKLLLLNFDIMNSSVSRVNYLLKMINLLSIMFKNTKLKKKHGTQIYEYNLQYDERNELAAYY